MHRDIVHHRTDFNLQGFHAGKSDTLCCECHTIIPRGEPCYNFGPWACCSWCLTDDVIRRGQEYWKGIQPPVRIWRPSREQEKQGWNHDNVTRRDGTQLEWMDRLDLD